MTRQSNLAGRRRIAIIGSTGSGKSTLGSQIARMLAIPFVELDALHWEPNWKEAPDEIFHERAARALSGDAWVADGNYHQVRDLVWGRADTLIWLDYTLPLVMWRLTMRTLRRCLTREVLWNGNRERLATQLLTRDSLFLWALQTYGRRRREFPRLLRLPEYAHLEVVHLRSPAALRAWLQRPHRRPLSDTQNGSQGRVTAARCRAP